MRATQVRFPLFPALILLIIATGCTAETGLSQIISGCPPGKDCSEASLTLTVAAYTPAAGDLGWGEVRGRVSDTVGSPIAGVEVTCTHRSNHPVSLCSGSVKTADDGSFVFPHIFFQNTDQIELSAHEPRRGDHISQEFFTHPGLYVNFTMPIIDLTQYPCCTAPACREDEVLTCPGVCRCGCGTTCATKTITPTWMVTQTPLITTTPISYPCIDCSFFWNALRDFCPLAANDETARTVLSPYGEIQQGETDGHTCLYVVVPVSNRSLLYYVNQVSSTVMLLYIDPNLLPPTETTTPQVP